MLSISNLSVYHGKAQTLRSVSLNVASGQIVTVLGANGAGKTTLLRAISGAHPAAVGQVLLEGEDITRLAPDKIVRRGLIQVPEGRQLFGPFTVRDNLELGAYHRRGKVPRSKIAEELASVFELFPVLRDRLQQRAGTLSGGEQQMLAIGRGLMGKPRVLLLDEPSVGLSPLLVTSILESLRELKKRGVTVLLVEQNAMQALRVADFGYVLQTGTIVLEDKAENLLQTESVWSAYLG